MQADLGSVREGDPVEHEVETAAPGRPLRFLDVVHQAADASPRGQHDTAVHAHGRCDRSHDPVFPPRRLRRERLVEAHLEARSFRQRPCRARALGRRFGDVRLKGRDRPAQVGHFVLGGAETAVGILLVPAQLRLEPGDVFPDLLGSLQEAVGLARVQIAQALVQVLEVVLKVPDVPVSGARRVLGGDRRGREGRDEGHR